MPRQSLVTTVAIPAAWRPTSRISTNLRTRYSRSRQVLEYFLGHYNNFLITLLRSASHLLLIRCTYTHWSTKRHNSLYDSGRIAGSRYEHSVTLRFFSSSFFPIVLPRLPTTFWNFTMPASPRLASVPGYHRDGHHAIPDLHLQHQFIPRHCLIGIGCNFRPSTFGPTYGIPCGILAAMA